MGQHGRLMTANLAEPPETSPVANNNVLARARAFVVGLGGALAGITAILYACGYLVTRAHQSLLGLYGLVEFNNDYILQEGAKFFLVMAYSVGRDMVMPLLTVLTAVVIVLFLLGLLLRTRAQRWRDAVRNRVAPFDAGRWVRAAGFAVLFILFLLHSDLYLDKFERPLCYANLLYAEAGATKCTLPKELHDDGIRKALLASDQVVLDIEFMELVLGLAKAVVLSYLTWRVTLPWRWRAWCVAPSFFATALYLILLPMDYGVLKRSLNYPRIALTLDDKTPFPAAGPVFLLNKSSSEFVVWGALPRKLYWVPVASVRRAEVDGAYDLFNSRWRANVPQGGNK